MKYQRHYKKKRNMTPTEFCGELKHETKDAYLVFDGDCDVWIPKSQVFEMDQLNNGMCKFMIPEWLAIDRGIV